MFQLREQEPKPVVQTLSPTFTGSSVLAIKYKDGVLIATDTLIGIGHTARQTSRERIIKLTDKCIIAASGDHADLQYISAYLREMQRQEEIVDDGFEKSAEEIHALLGRIMYNRRNKMNPLWTNLVIIGNNAKNGDPNFLGICDMWGTSLEESLWSNALGSYFALPHMRNAPPAESMTREDAIALLTKCFTITAGVDCTSSEEIQMAYVEKDGVHIQRPMRVQPRLL